MPADPVSALIDFLVARAVADVRSIDPPQPAANDAEAEGVNDAKSEDAALLVLR